MWQHTAKHDGGPNERVKFFITADRELDVAGSDALDFETLGRVLLPVRK